MKLEADRGGAGSPLLVLLHGLGATRQVWRPMLAIGRWKRSWLAPDLRGHGASAHGGSYALGLHAADVADLIRRVTPRDEFVIVGHSMGGVIALALASGWFGAVPGHAFGLGIKVAWTDVELARLAEMAAAPAWSFETMDAAVAHYLRISGLAAHFSADSEAARAGVKPKDGGWQLAADPAAASIGAPPMRALIGAARAPFHLARGEADRMVSHDQLRVLDPEATDLAGLGHNAMVESPEAVWDWIEAFVR